MVLLIAAAVILAGVVVVAMGRGGELARFPADVRPFEAEIVTAADVVLLRPPSALFGYNRQVSDDVLSAIARTITERDVEIATLRRQLAELQASSGPGAAGPARDARSWPASGAYPQARSAWDPPETSPAAPPWDPPEINPAAPPWDPPAAGPARSAWDPPADSPAPSAWDPPEDGPAPPPRASAEPAWDPPAASPAPPPRAAADDYAPAGSAGEAPAPAADLRSPADSPAGQDQDSPGEAP